MLNPTQTHFKIIHTTCHTQWGGLEKRIFNEAVWMRHHGHQVILVAPKDSQLFARAKKERFHVYPVSFSRMGFIQDYRSLVRIFQNELPDIVNTHGNSDTKVALAAAEKTKVPCRILSRHISAHVKNSWYNRRLYKQLCDYVFTTADYTTRHLQTLFNLKDTRVFSIPSGILPPDTLPSRESARTHLAERLGCPPETRFIGFVGRLSEDKGVTTLVQAFKQVFDHIPHHLVLVGSGPDEYRKRLEKLTRDLGIFSRTHFTGFTEDVWPVYRALDCKVLPSENINGIPFEGVPQALLEAMYCECPVIGSKTGGIPDIIQHGDTGLLFDPGDTGALAQQIRETLSRKTDTLKQVDAARENVQQFHTMDAMGKTILRIYQLHQIRLEQQKHTGDSRRNEDSR
jgi:glycosyltransferase involved in cell wall biosynthesis